MDFDLVSMRMSIKNNSGKLSPCGHHSIGQLQLCFCIQIETGKCTSDGRGKHWCDGTTIGYGNDTLNIGFSTIIDYTSSSESPLAAVIEFYRNETGSWHLSDTKTFGNDETKEIHLTETIVQGTNSELSTRSRRMIESSQWEYVNFTAMITKASDYVELQVCNMITPCCL